MNFAGFVMPIYAYRCESCGFTKDALQKISDSPLTVCPSCNQATFKKQVTAAGFQLKGTGWYVTDFRGGNAPASKSEGESKPASSTSAAPSTESKSDAKSETSSTSSTTPAPASTTAASD